MGDFLTVGDAVLWCGAWGTKPAVLAFVQRIERVRPGQKEGGVAVPRMSWSDVPDRAVVDLDNGHWAYGDQIQPVGNEAVR